MIEPISDRGALPAQQTTADFNGQLARYAHETLLPTAQVFAALYALLTGCHLCCDSMRPHMLATLSALTSALCCALAIGWRRIAPTSRQSHLASAGLIALVQLNGGLHLLLLQAPYHSTALVLAQVLAGFLALSWPYFAAASLLNLLAFLPAYLAALNHDPAWNGYLALLLAALVAAITLRGLRLRSLLYTQTTRERNETHCKAQLVQRQALAGLSELLTTQHSAQQLFEACTQTAQCTLGASHVAIVNHSRPLAVVGTPIVATPSDISVHRHAVDIGSLRGSPSRLQVQLTRPAISDIGPFLRSVGAILQLALQRADLQRQQEDTQRAIRHAQRMESLALLASGIAHDFNNLLTVIVGYAHTLSEGQASDSPLQAGLQEIRNASELATRLIQQLLASSERSTQLETFDLNEVVVQLHHMLRQSVPTGVELTVHPAQIACPITADRRQIELAVMNLLSNAVDAVRQGGHIHAHIQRVQLTDHAPQGVVRLPPGHYILLSIQDSGPGIADQALPHIFEPFFTTKDAEQHPGLGLATARGIVERCGGTISVYSGSKRGTRFLIYLPAAVATSRRTCPARPAATATTAAATTATIVVVEDNEAVRGYIVDTLRRAGYRILPSASGREALALVDSHTQAIDLVIAGMAMPHMPGGEVAKQLRKHRPGLRILFTSTHLDARLGGLLSLGDPAPAILRKPFTSLELRNAVNEALRGKSGHESSERI